MKVLSHTLELAGASLVSYGAWLLHPSAGYIAGGVLLLVGALALGRQSPEAATGEDAT